MRSSSKSAFTLIELLIVVVVIVTLLGIVFRLAGLGGESKARAMTIARLQKLENCLSGYYAAFGSYPPVPLHGVRDIYRKVNSDTGMQYADDSDSDDGTLNWARVRAACRSQPVAVEFPYNYKKVQKVKYFTSGGFDPISQRGVVNSKYQTSADWQEVQLFKFGLLSFLLPRYLFMTDCGISELYDNCKQWFANNRMGDLYDLSTGRQKYKSMKAFQQSMKYGESWTQGAKVSDSEKYAVEMNPSQMVCTRWLPNLEGIVFAGQTFYDVNITDTYFDSGDYNARGVKGVGDVDSKGGGYTDEKMAQYTSQDADSGGMGGNPYLLDGMTVLDGWGHDFYYYSPAPYQSYRLWSAGPNGKTFPPWIDLEEFSQKKKDQLDMATLWMADDVVHMSN